MYEHLFAERQADSNEMICPVVNSRITTYFTDREKSYEHPGKK